MFEQGEEITTQFSQKKALKPVTASDQEQQNNLSEKEKAYYQLGQLCLKYESDGKAIFAQLIEILANERSAEEIQKKITKLKNFFALNENVLADLEKRMAQIEQELGYASEKSSRFDNNENDILINSAIFYQDRIDALRKVTNNPDVDKEFVDSVVAYAQAVEHDNNSPMMVLYDDVKSRQEYMSNQQKLRSQEHNTMIDNLNKLNNLAINFGVKPLLYRNLVKNSVINNYNNDKSMHHDRASLVRYINQVINLSQDGRFPNTQYVKET